MNLREWTSNSKKLNERFVAQGTAAINQDKVKLCGLVWHPTDDVLTFQVEKIVKELDDTVVVTKRVGLAMAARIFDPLGLLEPFTIRSKILMQEAWKRRLPWDDPLPDDLYHLWWAWLQELKDLIELQVPRPYFLPCQKQLQLHVFSDSSVHAYGAVAYLRASSITDVKTSLIFAKTRVAPLKKQTIPRLELFAALLGSRLPSEKQLQPFVARRVEEIKELTASHEWQYCPSDSNPADVLTKGTPVNSLMEREVSWWTGPPWLSEPESKWPKWVRESKQERIEIQQEENSQEAEVANFAIPAVKEKPCIQMLIVPNHFSALHRLLRLTAWLLRFIQNCMMSKEKRENGQLTSSELSVAKSHWIKAIQAEAFGEEIDYLMGGCSKKGPAIVHQLQLTLDGEGLIRCRGRLENAFMSKAAKCPILLPNNCYVTCLIVTAAHLQVLHGGVRDTLTELRQQYWIPQGRQVVRKILKACQVCRRMEGPSYQQVVSPPLPTSRVGQGKAFSTVGVDFAGPLYVKSAPKGKVDMKVYVCLFTCTLVRAVHLEVTEDLSTGAFIRAFRRFASRRGIPEKLISDNATNFKQAAKKITSLSSHILHAEETQRYLSNHGVKWQFIVPAAPWWGGFYERLIGSVKQCLRKIIGGASLSQPELVTVVTEVEGVLNSRPLTYVYPDIQDGEPLTPAHFLCGHRLTSLPNIEQRNKEEDPEYPDPESVYETSGSKELSSRIKYHETLMEKFWGRWRQEYLVSLRDFHSQPKGSTSSDVSPPQVGDVVLVKEKQPRAQWRLAVVEKKIVGRDGLERAAQVRTSNGNKFLRPLQLLFPLEASKKTDEGRESMTANGQSEHAQPRKQGLSLHEDDKQEKPQRTSARKALENIKLWTK